MRFLKKDKRRRAEVCKNEFRVFEYKYRLCQQSNVFHERCYYYVTFFKKKWRYSRVFVRNRCLSIYRSRWVIVYFKLSRHAFKDLSSKGKICGVKKSSW